MSHLYFENCSLPDSPSCGSNQVIRHNEVRGDPAHHFMDGIGGEDNFSANVRTFPTVAGANGQVSIGFTSVTNSALLNGLELF